MKTLFSVKNWDTFQHYKDRNPPWIKLHNHLLDDYEFEDLPDNAKCHLLCIWMLASRTNNEMVYDPQWVKRKIGANSTVDLELLKSVGFIEVRGEGQHASNPLVSEEESQRRGEKTIPYQLIVDAYHEILPELSGVKLLNDTRKKAIKARWNSKVENINTLDFWNRYFNYVRTSDFLMGTKTDFSASFDFLIKESSMLKTIEGNYDNAK